MRRLAATRKKSGQTVAKIAKIAPLRGPAVYRIDACSDVVRRDVERWLKMGFVQVLHDKGRALLRVRPTDVDFLERLAEFLRFFGFVVELS